MGSSDAVRAGGGGGGFARLLGCRLPTPEEFGVALDAVKGAPDRGSWNLRDAMFKRSGNVAARRQNRTTRRSIKRFFSRTP